MINDVDSDGEGFLRRNRLLRKRTKVGRKLRKRKDDDDDDERNFIIIVDADSHHTESIGIYSTVNSS